MSFWPLSPFPPPFEAWPVREDFEHDSWWVGFQVARGGEHCAWCGIDVLPPGFNRPVWIYGNRIAEVLNGEDPSTMGDALKIGGHPL